MLGTTTITHSPMLGVKKMLIVVVSSGIDSEINKKNIRKKNKSKTLKIIENHRTFLDFWSLQYIFLKQTKHRKKIWHFFVQVLHDA